MELVKTAPQRTKSSLESEQSSSAEKCYYEMNYQKLPLQIIVFTQKLIKIELSSLIIGACFVTLRKLDLVSWDRKSSGTTVLCRHAVGKHLFWTTAFWEETWFEILINGLAAYVMGFRGGSDSKEITCNAEDLGLIPGLGRSPGGGHGNPLQYSCLENLHGQRSLAGYIQSMGSQRIGHNWTAKHNSKSIYNVL